MDSVGQLKLNQLHTLNIIFLFYIDKSVSIRALEEKTTRWIEDNRPRWLENAVKIGLTDFLSDVFAEYDDLSCPMTSLSNEIIKSEMSEIVVV